MNEEYENLRTVLMCLIADIAPIIGYNEAQRLVDIIDDMRKGGKE